MAVKRILVPIDFSPDSLNALTYACDFAKRFGAELLILHVVDQTYLASTPELSLANPRFGKLLEEQWRVANTQTERLGADLKKRHLRFRTFVRRGTPSQVIVEAAQRNAADLIIMSTHGHTGLAHMLIGSVAERVVRSAHCAVLTVRRAAKRRKSTKRP